MVVVPYYRFYFLDTAGHIDRHHEAILADDAAAKDEAVRLDHSAAIEIWSQKRHVAKVIPDHKRGRRPSPWP